MIESTSPVTDPDYSFMAAPLPRILWVELTSKCPFDCIFCSRRLRRENGEHLDFELYRSLISELREPEIIRLNYSGESVHYPYLIEAIKLAKSTEAETELVSAFSSASDALIEDLILSGLDRLTISLHTMLHDQFGEIYGFTTLDQMRDRISRLIEFKQKLNSRHPQIDFAFVAMKRNLRELLSVAAYARKIGVTSISVLPVIRRDPIPLKFDEERSSAGLKEPFKSNLREILQESRHRYKDVHIAVCDPAVESDNFLDFLPKGFPGRLPENARIRSCDQNPWETLHVLADGHVVLCEVQDHIPLGNLRELSLVEIWRGRAYKSVRRKYVEGALPECVTCTWKQAYRAAPLSSAIHTKDGMSPQLFTGWYEQDSYGTIWSKKEAVLVLGGAAAARNLRLQGVLPHALDGLENTLHISCNGEDLGIIVNPTGTLLTFDTSLGPIPQPARALVLTFTVRKAFRSLLAGINKGGRDLGFALQRVELI